LSLPEIQEVLDRWSSQGFFRLHGLGRRVRLESVVGCFSYTVQLRTELERRTLERASEPYHGGLIDDSGAVPNCWDFDVAAPTDFETRTQRIPVPHTDRVETCSRCGGPWSGELQLVPRRGTGALHDMRGKRQCYTDGDADGHRCERRHDHAVRNGDALLHLPFRLGPVYALRWKWDHDLRPVCGSRAFADLRSGGCGVCLPG
jgi:hypothetical protein